MSQTILVPLDLNQELVIDSVFTAVKRVAGTEPARIVLLTVIPEIDVGDFPYVETEYLQKLGATARNQLERIGHEQIGDSHDWEVDVRIGPVGRTIVRRADRFEADLIVMASHNPVFWDVLLGSIAAQVVKHARHSVLVVRQKEPARREKATPDVSRDARPA